MSKTTLYLGNCIEVMKSMPDKSIDAVIVDPPYGINYESNHCNHHKFNYIYGDNKKDLNFAWLYETYRITKDSGCLFCFCRWDTEPLFMDKIIDAGWNLKSEVIWDRIHHGLGDLKRAYAPSHDNALFAIKKDFVFPSKRPKSVYRVMRVNNSSLVHPTQKPIELMKKIIIDLTKKDDIIIDPFMGSGSTGVACVQNGRNFIGIEIEQNYFSIAEKRIADAKKTINVRYREVKNE